MYLGVTLSQLDDFDNAAAAFTRAITMEPAEGTFRINFGEGASLGSLSCYDKS